MDSGASRTGTPCSVRSSPHSRRTPVKSVSPILSRCLRRNSSSTTSSSSLDAAVVAVSSRNRVTGALGSRVKSFMHQNSDVPQEHHPPPPELHRHPPSSCCSPAAARPGSGTVSSSCKQDARFVTRQQLQRDITPNSTPTRARRATLSKMSSLWSSIKNSSPVKKAYNSIVTPKHRPISISEPQDPSPLPYHDTTDSEDRLPRDKNVLDPLHAQLKTSGRLSFSHSDISCSNLPGFVDPDGPDWKINKLYRDDMAIISSYEPARHALRIRNQWSVDESKETSKGQRSDRHDGSNTRSQYPFYQLEVHLNSGKDLLAKDAGGTSDPYVKFKLGKSQVYRSRTINKTLNPCWNEHFMTILDDVHQTLVLRAYDSDFGFSDDFLGTASIELSKLKWNEAIEMTLNLTETGKEREEVWGQITLGLRLQPKTQEEKECLFDMLNDQTPQLFGKGLKANTVISSSADGSVIASHEHRLKKQKTQTWDSVVHIILKEARSLSIKDENGFSDPYVRFRMGTEKYKSKVVCKSLNPVWNEQFALHTFPDQSRILEVIVYDKDPHRDEFMGHVSIDLNSLAPEETHDIVRELEGGEGTIHMIITVSGTLTAGGISDLMTYSRNFPDLEKQICSKYGLLRTLSNVHDVGFLTVKVYKAENVAAADFSGKSDPFCVVQLVNSRLQTNTQYKTLSPEWNKIFTFRVKDVHEAIHVTVYDEDPNKKFEFLGRVMIPLLRIENNVKKWYVLKDKRCMTRSKGQIQLELNLTYNPLRACVRTVNPKEDKLLNPDPKFKRNVFIRNVTRTKAMVMEFVEVIKFINSCFLWESVPRSLTAFILFMLTTYFFEAYMAPLALLLLFAKHFIWNTLSARFGTSRSPAEDEPCDELVECVEEDLDDGEDEVEKKSLREKLQTVQEITALVQNVLGEIASFGERVKNVPFLSNLAIAALAAAAIILFFVPLRYLIMIWGLNKFTKKLRSPNAINNNELLDFISRVPDTDEKAMYRELKVIGHSDALNRKKKTV